MPKLGFTYEECEKFDRFVAALSANNFDDMDKILDQFAPAETERFEKYLNELKPHEIQTSLQSELGLGPFFISMFKHFKSKLINNSARVEIPTSRRGNSLKK